MTTLLSIERRKPLLRRRKAFYYDRSRPKTWLGIVGHSASLDSSDSSQQSLETTRSLPCISSNQEAFRGNVIGRTHSVEQGPLHAASEKDQPVRDGGIISGQRSRLRTEGYESGDSVSEYSNSALDIAWKELAVSKNIHTKDILISNDISTKLSKRKDNILRPKTEGSKRMPRSKHNVASRPKTRGADRATTNQERNNRTGSIQAQKRSSKSRARRSPERRRGRKSNSLTKNVSASSETHSTWVETLAQDDKTRSDDDEQVKKSLGAERPGDIDDASMKTGEERTERKGNSEGSDEDSEESEDHSDQEAEEKAMRRGKLKGAKKGGKSRGFSKRPTSVLFGNKKELSVLARDFINNKRRFSEFQQRMAVWLNDNYYRLIDLFRRFDFDKSGKLTYDEFYMGMIDLGAPVTLTETYIMAMSLDSDNDDTIDYGEFKKLKQSLRAGSAASTISDNLSTTSDEPPDTRAQLRPCPNCEIGIWEPINHDVPRYFCLQLKSIGIPHKDPYIGHMTIHVMSDITIYGITRLVKKELGGSAVDVRILRRRDKKEMEALDLGLKLKECGYEGGKSIDEPENVQLFYDYVYPKLDCPLLLANFSI